MDALLPARTIERTEIEEPMLKKSKHDALDPALK
jgi:hypothetical protein